MKLIIYIVICLMCISLAHAAAITGSIYDFSLNKAKDVIVEIDTSPNQKYIAKDGTYNFNVPLGNYTITAKVYSDNLLDATASENISVTDNEEYNLDLILFPYLGEDEELISDIDTEKDFISLPETNFEKESGEKSYVWWFVGISLLAFAAIISIILFSRKPRKTETLISVTQDLQGLIEIIRKEGGRTTQKQIRKHLPLSEAKISLMIAELEEKGIIEKLKKGRGNIIILKR